MTDAKNEAAGGASHSDAKLGAAQTHGFGIKAQDGAAEREIDVALFDDGSYRISFTTNWQGKDEPVVTRLAMSGAGFSLFSNAIIEAALNMQNWPTPKAPNEQ